MHWVILGVIFVLGAAVGSFLNVVILRLGTGSRFWQGRSACLKCGQELRWFELVPVLSFVFQKGRCRRCKSRLLWQYPLVEISAGILFALVYLKISAHPIDSLSMSNLVFWWFFVSLLIIIFVYDLKYQIIPDPVVYPGIIGGLIYALVPVAKPFLLGQDFISHFSFLITHNPFFSHLLAAVGGALFFLLLFGVTRGKGMGLGDVKLAGFMGLILGFLGFVYALILAFVSGALVGLGLILAGKKTLKSQIPFGPFLAGATILAFLVG